MGNASVSSIQATSQVVLQGMHNRRHLGPKWWFKGSLVRICTAKFLPSPANKVMMFSMRQERISLRVLGVLVTNVFHTWTAALLTDKPTSDLARYTFDRICKEWQDLWCIQARYHPWMAYCITTESTNKIRCEASELDDICNKLYSSWHWEHGISWADLNYYTHVCGYS